MRFLATSLLLALYAFCFGQSDTALVRQYLAMLTKTEETRRFDHPAQLEKTAGDIEAIFKKYADSVVYQPYEVEGRVFKNVIASFGTGNKERIIVGAHYDACGEQPGADDNASGVTGLLELARLLKGKNLKHRIDLVAYCTEEPPYFGSENMGSAVHAKYMKDNKVAVKGMISLEMLGYFKDARRTQAYPFKILSLFYGTRGNYITAVRKFGSGKFARKFSRKFKHKSKVKAKRFAGLGSLVGIDLSDHLYYWQYGFSALMITDTSWYRNHNYHLPSDSMETLDIPRMTKVIDAVFKALLAMK
jgi:hypothetical protein